MDSGAAASYKGRVKVLVVEDEKKIASFVRNGLGERGFVVDVCHRGDQGCESIAFVTGKEEWAAFFEATRAAARDGKIVVLKGWPGFTFRQPEMMQKPHAELARLANERITFPLACFLVAAEPNCYFCYTWGYREQHGTFDWYPEFDKPLGRRRPRRKRRDGPTSGSSPTPRCP